MALETASDERLSIGVARRAKPWPHLMPSLNDVE